MKSDDFYKVGFFLLAGVFLLLTGAVASWWYFNSQSKPQKEEETPTPTAKAAQQPAQATGDNNDTNSDESAPTPTVKTKSDLEQIQEAMAEKYNKPIQETSVNITQTNGTHARGSVSFNGEVGGGWLLAAKVDNEWVIVDDGNGTIMCEIIEPYNFPTSIVEECIDSEGNPVQR